MNTNGVPPESVNWMLNAQIKMMNLNNQMNQEKTTGNESGYYKLRNKAILERIEFQKEMISLHKKDSFSISRHEKISKLVLQLTPLKQQAEARNQFVDNQFKDPQIQNDINNEFNQADVLFEKIEKKLAKLLEFKEQHSASLDGGRLYLWNAETHCSGPECEKTKFTTALDKCGRCYKVLYCSRSCQKKDWATHKLTCKEPESK